MSPLSKLRRQRNAPSPEPQAPSASYAPLSVNLPSSEIPLVQPSTFDDQQQFSEESSETRIGKSASSDNDHEHRLSDDGSRNSHQLYDSRHPETNESLYGRRSSTIASSNTYFNNAPYSSRLALNTEYSSKRDSLFDPTEMAVHNTTDHLKDSPPFAAPAPSHAAAAYVPVPSASPTLHEQQMYPPSSKLHDSPSSILKPSPPPSSIPPNKDLPPQQPPQPQAAVVLARKNRMAWIDGLRGLASLVIFTHHFSDLTFSDSHPKALEWNTVYSFIRNGQLAVAMYFLLGGRVLAYGFQRSAFAPPKIPKDSHGAPIPGAAPVFSGGPKWLTLSSSLFRRSIRLAFPAIIVAFIQWKVCVDGLMNTTVRANAILEPTSLWIPGWCSIGDFGGFLRFCLDLFTLRNRQYLLFAGSALWTTYDQFWGSVLVYITAAVSAQLHWRGRYLVYTIMILALFFANMSNMLYIVGLWLSDLHASGFIRKLQNHWIPTIAVEVCVMAIGLALIAGGNKVGEPSDKFFGHVTIYEGKFNWNPDTHWPQQMFFSNWVPAACILIWVEVSHAMQWFCSWGIFCWIGKVSYGFYLMQFLIIYGIMPHLIIYFNDQHKSFWNMIVPTYIICLICNFVAAWISYHLLDRIGLKLGKWIWDGLFVSKPKNATALPLKAAKALVTNAREFPGYAFNSVTTGAKNTYTGTISFVHTVFNWRSQMGIKPVVSTPDDPTVRAQLYSTRWDTDISQDPEAWRTHKLLKFQSWTWIFHIFWIPGFTFIWTYFHPTGDWTFDAVSFSTLWRFVWIMSVPNCIAAYLGFATPDRAPPKEEMDRKPVTRECIRNFFIVLVTKGSNETAVRRGYDALIKLEKYHPAVKTIVLTDEPYVYPDLQNVVCPKDYKSPLGMAKYKARALDYFRHHVSLGVYDWVLHMDEESVTDAETIRRCFEFIRYTKHHFGQGTILYNGVGYWDNWFFTVADGLRVGDDLARFHFQNTVVNRPIFGVHGSFLLTNGQVENECTWDFGTLAEDFEMSQDAWRRGFSCGRIHGIVREQSPGTVRDFMKQRRRWFMGIRDIKGMYGLPNLATNLWTVGVFTMSVTLINIPFIAVDSSDTPLWIAICGAFCFASFMTLYIWGLFFQELDYGQKIWKIPIHLLCAIPIQPFASILEGLSAIWAMSSEDFGKFEVITKR